MFRLIVSPAYQRNLSSALKQIPSLAPMIDKILDILEEDPYNLSRQHNIKKLTNLEKGEGQWRIRAGKYRLRYDILDQDVVLYSFSHRKDAY